MLVIALLLLAASLFALGLMARELTRDRSRSTDEGGKRRLRALAMALAAAAMAALAFGVFMGDGDLRSPWVGATLVPAIALMGVVRALIFRADGEKMFGAGEYPPE